MILTWWIKSFKTQSKFIKVGFGDEIVQSLVKRVGVGNSLENPNLHFTEQNLVKPPSKPKVLHKEMCTTS